MSVLRSLRTVFLTSPLSSTKCLQLLPKAQFHTSQVVQLYSPESLGLDQYVQTRERNCAQFAKLKDKFLKKMDEFVDDGPKNMVFSEDLKNMVYIADKQDLPLAGKMIKKFNNQSSEFRFGSFVFGPVVMRMYHYLDAPDEALQCYNEVKSTPFFDQLTSHQVLMDLLYRHARYDQLIQVFDDLKQKQINMTKFPKYCVTLVMAACYKQNTPESLEYACSVLREMSESGSEVLRRAASFAAGLALNQGAPHIAMEVISQQRPHYVTVRNIKAIALAEMGRVDDALPILRSVLDIDKPSQRDKHNFLRETVEKVKRAVDASGNKDLLREFSTVERALLDRALVDEQTLDDILCKEILLQRRNQNSSQALLHASYQGYRRVPQHSGLRDNEY